GGRGPPGGDGHGGRRRGHRAGGAAAVGGGGAQFAVVLRGQGGHGGAAEPVEVRVPLVRCDQRELLRQPGDQWVIGDHGGGHRAVVVALTGHRPIAVVVGQEPA